MDNHGSHLTRQFLEYCSDNKIIPFTFPPHLTHRLQPLDLIPFQQYKLRHGQTVNKAARLGAGTFDKIDFLAAIEDIRKRTFQPRIIQAGWRDSGIRPFRSTEKMDEIRGRSSSPILNVHEGALKDPTPEDTSDEDSGENSGENSTPSTPIRSAEPPQTPTTIRGLRQQIENSIKSKPDLSPSIQRVFRGALTQGEIGAQSREELEQYLEYHQKREKTRSSSKAYMKSQGVMYAKHAIREIERTKAEKVCKEWKKMMNRTRKELREAISRENLSSESEPDLPQVPRPYFMGRDVRIIDD